MNTSLVQQCQEYVEQLFLDKLSQDFTYHNLAHTLSVKKYVERLGKAAGLEKKQIQLLSIAALFHDTGFIERYEGHEESSKKNARAFLESKAMAPKDIEQILNCIDATKMEASPEGQFEQLLKDADLNSIGSEVFLQNSSNLRQEWKVCCDTDYTDLEWLQNNLDFLEQHQYYSPEAQKLFGNTKKANLKKVKKMLKKEKDKAEKRKQSEKISGNRSAQMMFKTALRNHIDLTNIADNKANILLTISTGILTFGLPIASAYLSSSPYLMAPTIILMLTCLFTIIFATLATRPIEMSGQPSPELLRNGKSNLFFFGNFYKMNIEDYQANLKAIISNEEYLENIIISDLFYLGKALGEKYARLRKCYLVFMIGITATVIAYVVSFSMHAH
ncbi:MAG: Pycsar system effector family protein [Bacteroidota bacterium]